MMELESVKVNETWLFMKYGLPGSHKKFQKTNRPAWPISSHDPTQSPNLPSPSCFTPPPATYEQ